jgi:hypothetical protein
MLIMEKGTNNYEVSTVITLSSLNKRIPQIIPKFSNVLKLEWKKVTMSLICKLMIILRCPLVCIVIVDESSYNFYVNTLRTVPIEYKSIVSKILLIF